MTFYRWIRAIVLTPFKAIFRVQVVGREHIPKGGAYIVAPSHRSIFDIPFAAFVTRRRIRFMAKSELFSTKFGRWFFQRMGAIEVVRDTTDRGALRASRAALDAGEPLGIFPEGTRRSGPKLEELYDGVAYLALKHGVPIVPVGIGGSEQILPSGKVFPRLHKVAIVVGAPIVPDAAAGVRRRSDIARVTTVLDEQLQACFDEAQRRAGISPAAAPSAPGASGPGASAAESREHV